MIDTVTFLNVWYWVFLALFWSLVTNWTFGVSVWSLARAKSSDEDLALAATLARRSIARTARMAENPPLFHWTFQAFLLGAILTLGVLRDNEIAQGLLFIALPMLGFAFWRGQVALRLAKAVLADEALLREIVFIRRVKQALGVISIGAAATYGVWLNKGDIFWRLGG